MRPSRFTLLVLACAVAALPAAGETLYKMVDRQGKVTYGEKPPKDFDGQVTRIDIDPKANTATLPKPPAPAAAPPKVGPDVPVGIKVVTNAERARDNLDKARKALEEARANPEYRYIANAGAGTRQVPSEDYQARVAQLEQAVKKAEAEAAKFDAK